MRAAYARLWVNGLGLLLSWVLIAPIRLYQKAISPLTPPSCRYHPSCSEYGCQALRVHGPFKGLVLTGWRIVRCNPWSGGGVDPVPSRGCWQPDVFPDGRARTSVNRPDVPAPPGHPAPTASPGA